MTRTRKKIDLETHFLTEQYIQYLHCRKGYPTLDIVEDDSQRKFHRIWYGPNLCQSRSLDTVNALLELGERRLADMDSAGISVQVLSLVDPGCELFDAAEAPAIAREVNDEVARAIKKYPEKFVGLAALAPQSPDKAADELERAVNKLGFKGAKINSNVREEYLDDRKYWPIFERAARLGVPIYLHPMVPSRAVAMPYATYGYSLAGPSLGFAAEAALHAMRLIYSGLFDEYPELKIILV